MQSKIILDAKKYVSEKLFPLKQKWYNYHNLDHTLDVFSRSSYLWMKEWLNEELQEIIQISALFHDIWFLKQYDDNEIIWANMAEEWLNENNYPVDKIDIIKQTILSTIPTYLEPKNILEKIIKDADLDNLWRDDFEEKSQALKQELINIKWNDFNEKKWLEWTKQFILWYNFYTKTQIEERWKKLEENKEKILKFK